MGKGSPTTSNTQQNQNVSYAPAGLQNFQDIYNTANQAASTPYQPYGGQLTAGLNDTQLAGINNINMAQGAAAPAINHGGELIQQGAGMTSQGYDTVGQGANVAQGGLGYIDAAGNMIQGAQGITGGGLGYIGQGSNTMAQGQGMIGQGANIAQGSLGYLNQGANLSNMGAGMAGQGAGYLGYGAGMVGQGANISQSGQDYLNAGAGMVGQGSNISQSGQNYLNQGANTIGQGTGIAQQGQGYFNQGAGMMGQGYNTAQSGQDYLNAGAGMVGQGSNISQSGQNYLNQGANTIGQGTNIAQQGQNFFNQGAGMMGQGYNTAQQGQGFFNQGAQTIGQGAGIAQQGQGYFNQGANTIGQGAGIAQQGQGYFNQGANTIGQGAGIAQQGQGYFGAGANLMGAGSNLVGKGTGMVDQSGQPIGAQQINQYLNPYQQDVTNATMANINETNTQQQQQLMGNAAMQGALGGDRSAVAGAELARQQGLASNQTLAGLNQQNYQSAMQTALSQQQAGIQAGQATIGAGGQLGQLGSQVSNVGSQYGQLGSQVGALGSQQANIGSQYGQLGSQVGALGSQQANIGSQYGQLGSQVGALGSQQANIGSQYGQLGSQMGALGSQVSNVGSQYGQLGSQVGALGSQQANVGSQYGQLGATVSGQGTQMAGVGSQYGQLGSQMGALGSQVSNVGSQYGQLGSQVGAIGSQQANIGSQYGQLGSQVGALGSQQSNVGSQYGNLGSQVSNQGTQMGSMGSQLGQLGATVSGQGTQMAGVGSQYGGLGSQMSNIGGQMGAYGTAQAGIGQGIGSLGGQMVGAGGQQAGLAGQQANIGSQLSGQASQYGALGGQQANIGQTIGSLGTQQAGVGSAYGNLGSQYAGLGTQAQAADLQVAQSQLGAGTLAQQTQQSGLTSQYQQYLQQLAFPYQQAQFMAGIGLPAAGAMGGQQFQTGTVNQVMTPPGINAAQAIVGGGSLAYGLSGGQMFNARGGRINPYAVGGSVKGYASGGGPDGSQTGSDNPWDAQPVNFMGGTPGGQINMGPSTMPHPLPNIPVSQPPQQGGATQALSQINQLMNAGKGLKGLGNNIFGQSNTAAAASPAANAAPTAVQSAAPSAPLTTGAPPAAGLSGAESGTGVGSQIAAGPGAGFGQAAAGPGSLMGSPSSLSGGMATGTDLTGAGGSGLMGGADATGLMGADASGVAGGAGLMGADAAGTAGLMGADAGAGAAAALAGDTGAALAGEAAVAATTAEAAAAAAGVGELAAGAGALGFLALLNRGGRINKYADGGGVETIPESPATLKAQQDQLISGHVSAQMFPEGTPELPLPRGFNRIETQSGVFHFNPQKINPDSIRQAASSGHENLILGLGPVTKDEAIHRVTQFGETPLAVVERQPNGTEVRTAVGTDKTARIQYAHMDKSKSPGNTIHIESPEETVARRMPRHALGGRIKSYAEGGSPYPSPSITAAQGHVPQPTQIQHPQPFYGQALPMPPLMSMPGAQSSHNQAYYQALEAQRMEQMGRAMDKMRGSGEASGGRIGYDDGGDVPVEANYPDSQVANNDQSGSVNVPAESIGSPSPDQLYASLAKPVQTTSIHSASLQDPQQPTTPFDSKYTDAIKKIEGFTPKATWDVHQYSNGYGTKAAYPGEVIDRATAEQRFNRDYGKAASSVDKIAPNAPTGVKAALSSLTYNAGAGWMNAGLGKVVKSGDWNSVADKMLQYNRAGGRMLPGLADRRAQEASWIGNEPSSSQASSFTPMPSSRIQMASNQSPNVMSDASGNPPSPYPSANAPSPLDTAPWPSGPMPSGNEPSPLDTANYPSGPNGTPITNPPLPPQRPNIQAQQAAAQQHAAAIKQQQLAQAYRAKLAMDKTRQANHAPYQQTQAQQDFTKWRENSYAEGGAPKDESVTIQDDQPNQPSPLDDANWPSGPVGAPITNPPLPPERPNNPVPTSQEAPVETLSAQSRQPYPSPAGQRPFDPATASAAEIMNPQNYKQNLPQRQGVRSMMKDPDFWVRAGLGILGTAPGAGGALGAIAKGTEGAIGQYDQWSKDNLSAQQKAQELAGRLKEHADTIAQSATQHKDTIAFGREKMAQELWKPTGTTDIMGNPLLFNSKTGETKTAKQISASGGASPADVSAYDWAKNNPDNPLASGLLGDAVRYLKTGTVPANMGRGTQGMQKAQRIRNVAYQMAAEQGIPAEQLPKNWQEFKGEQIGIQRFLSGPQGNTIRSLNVVVDHAETLRQLGDSLKNGNIQLFNKVAQEWAQQTGHAAPTNFDMAKGIVGTELIKSLGVAQAGTENERAELGNRMSRASSPEQLSGIINEVVKPLLGGQLRGLRQQFTTSTGLKEDKFNSMLFPKTIDYLEPHNAATTAAPTMSPTDKSAMDWANANPTDPRSAAIKKHLGVQ